MSGKPKISIIMSVYNGQTYLREAVDSILNQTFTDYEFIIINDGSTDQTEHILNTYQDPKIRTFHQQNIGLTKSLNKGIQISKGEYIARQDADDVSLPDRLTRQVDFLDANPGIGMVGGYSAFIDKNGSELRIWEVPVSDEDIKQVLMSRGSVFPHGCVLIRRGCIHDVGGYREAFTYAQDYDLWLRISEQYKMANIDSVLYKNRRTDNTISRKKLAEQLNFRFLAQQLYAERQEKGYDSLDNIDLNNIEGELIHRYHMDESEIIRIKTDTYLNKFNESLISGDFFSALGMWWQAFTLHPQMWKIKYLMQKSISYFSDQKASTTA